MTTMKTPTSAQTPTAKSPTAESTPLTKTSVVTLEQLANEMKVSPRDARMLLRLASKQTKQYPNLGKEHVARQPWQWSSGSKALEEARKALAANAD